MIVIEASPYFVPHPSARPSQAHLPVLSEPPRHRIPVLIKLVSCHTQVQILHELGEEYLLPRRE